MDIYIKLKKTAEIGKKGVVLKDICDIIADKKIKELKILNSFEDKQVLSIIDIIKKIQKTAPNATINSIGEMDIVLKKPAKEKKWWLRVKVCIISIMLFIGSSTAIMSFHTDGEIGQIFIQYHRIIFNEENKNPYIINIPYSIGLAAGIILFFNHFGKKKIKNEPTPIEVSMQTYESDVSDTIVEEAE